MSTHEFCRFSGALQLLGIPPRSNDQWLVNRMCCLKSWGVRTCSRSLWVAENTLERKKRQRHQPREVRGNPAPSRRSVRLPESPRRLICTRCLARRRISGEAGASSLCSRDIFQKTRGALVLCKMEQACVERVTADRTLTV